MKYNKREDAILKEEEAYQNNLYPTKKPISSDEIKKQLNNSFRSAYSNISKNNITYSNFFQESNIGFQSNKNIFENNQKDIDIIPDINYTNQIIKENKNTCSTMKNLKESNLVINGNEKNEISIINFSKENTFKSNKKLIPIENPNPNQSQSQYQDQE